MSQLEQFSALERDAIENAFLHGDYCGRGALAKANIKCLREEFGDLEGEFFTLRYENYSTVFVKFNWDIFENRRDCIIGDSQGIYIPRIFAVKLSEHYSGASQSDIDICAKGPHENENYWEAWQTILDSEFIDASGKECTLEQDGDLFRVYPVSPEIERLHEVLSALIDYPVIDDEAFSKQESEEEEDAVKTMAQYPGDLCRALKARGGSEDLIDKIEEMSADDLEQLIYEALSRASESQGWDITVHEPQGAYIDCDKLAPHFLIERQWQAIQ